MEQLLTELQRDYKQVSFKEGSRFSWFAAANHISYKSGSKTSEPHNKWALLHEVGHALLGHASYRNDIELLQLEVAAWEKARELASKYAVDIDEDYIQDCLDTYRDWLHLRATCPTCYARALQASARSYRCFNCQTEWQVTRSRLCRPYRRKG